MKATERRIRRSPAGRKILAAVRAAEKRGFTIVDGGDVQITGHDKCCCPLQSLNLDPPWDDFVEAAARACRGPAEGRLESSWIFAMGFDGETVAKACKCVTMESDATPAEFRRYRHLFDLGRDFRRLLLPEERLVKR